MMITVFSLLKKKKPTTTERKNPTQSNLTVLVQVHFEACYTWGEMKATVQTFSFSV